MRFLSYCAILTVSLGLFSNSVAQHEHHEEQDHHHETGETTHDLATNHGEKWKMDDHTRSMFGQMSKRVNTHSGDNKALGAALQTDLNKLIQGCTMTGDAHNELHKFLVLYMPVVKRLSESGKKEDLERARGLLKLYPDYFE